MTDPTPAKPQAGRDALLFAQKLRRVRVVPWNDAIETFDAWFHVWSGTSERAYAIVETDGGQIIHCESRDGLKFLEQP